MNYKLNEEKMFADIADGIAVIINSETGIYFGLNEFGTAVYRNLVNGARLEDITDAVKNIPGCPDNVDRTINGFIDELLNKEIIISDSENSSDVSLDSEVMLHDNFIPTLNEYNDAQELLLADPIHEVKEEEGWTPEKSSLNKDEEDVARRKAKIK